MPDILLTLSLVAIGAALWDLLGPGALIGFGLILYAFALVIA